MLQREPVGERQPQYVARDGAADNAGIIFASVVYRDLLERRVDREALFEQALGEQVCELELVAGCRVVLPHLAAWKKSARGSAAILGPVRRVLRARHRAAPPRHLVVAVAAAHLC